MRIFKILLFPFIAFLVYLLLLGTVFFGSGSITDIWTTIGLQIIILIFLQFSSIIINKKTLLRISLAMVLLGIITGVIALGFLTQQHAIFLFLTHISLAGFFLSWYYCVASTKKRYYRSTAHQWLNIVSILLSITYAATIWTAGAAINLNCNDLRDQSIGFLTQFIPSLDMDSGIFSWISKIDSLWSQSIWQALGTDKYSWVNKISLWISTTGALLVVPNTGQIVNISTPQEAEESGSIIWSLLSYQEVLINGLIENQNIINGQVCEVTLSHINSLSKDSDIQIIVFILLTLLLYIFMKTITFVIGIINYILLILLFKTGRFQRKYNKEKVENITI